MTEKPNKIHSYAIHSQALDEQKFVIREYGMNEHFGS